MQVQCTVQDQQDARTDTSPADFAIREGKSLLRNNAAVDRDTSLPEKSDKFGFRDPGPDPISL